VNPHNHSIALFATTVFLLPVVNGGCIQPSVIVAKAPAGRVVESCHRTIRARAIDRLGGPATYSFDTPETFFISSATEGVRGGAMHRGRRGDSRLAYTCVVNIHSGRVEGARFRVVGADQRGDEWPTAACQQAVREEVAADRGRGTAVDFDRAESSYVSPYEEGVSGRGRLRNRKAGERIRYECTVDLHRGRVSRADYSTLEKPHLSDAGVVKLCQGAIADRLRSEGRHAAKTTFKSGQAFFLSKFERSVRGQMNLKSRGSTQRAHYECSVDVRRERVTAAHYRSVGDHPASNPRIVEACQMVTLEMAAADHGRRARIDFAPVEVVSPSRHESTVTGGGVLKVGGSRDPIRYRCSVHPRNLKITDARYRKVVSPPDRTQRTVDLCHEELRARVAADRKGRLSVVFDTSETYYISNAEEGVRGRGAVKDKAHDRDPIRYQCTVNIRRGRVAKAGYRYR